jgi:hypothetical protein
MPSFWREGRLMEVTTRAIPFHNHIYSSRRVRLSAVIGRHARERSKIPAVRRSRLRDGVISVRTIGYARSRTRVEPQPSRRDMRW